MASAGFSASFGAEGEAIGAITSSGETDAFLGLADCLLLPLFFFEGLGVIEIKTTDSSMLS